MRRKALHKPCPLAVVASHVRLPANFTPSRMTGSLHAGVRTTPAVITGFTVRTEPGFNTPIYQCAFTTTPGQWEEHRLLGKDFVPTFRGRVLSDLPPLNPAKVLSVGFLIADKQAGPFRLEICWVKAGREE